MTFFEFFTLLAVGAGLAATRAIYRVKILKGVANVEKHLCATDFFRFVSARRDDPRRKCFFDGRGDFGRNDETSDGNRNRFECAVRRVRDNFCHLRDDHDRHLGFAKNYLVAADGNAERLISPLSTRRGILFPKVLRIIFVSATASAFFLSLWAVALPPLALAEHPQNFRCSGGSSLGVYRGLDVTSGTDPGSLSRHSQTMDEIGISTVLVVGCVVVFPPRDDYVPLFSDCPAVRGTSAEPFFAVTNFPVSGFLYCGYHLHYRSNDGDDDLTFSVDDHTDIFQSLAVTHGILEATLSSDSDVTVSIAYEDTDQVINIDVAENVSVDVNLPKIDVSTGITLVNLPAPGLAPAFQSIAEGLAGLSGSVGVVAGLSTVASGIVGGLEGIVGGLSSLTLGGVSVNIEGRGIVNNVVVNNSVAVTVDGLATLVSVLSSLTVSGGGIVCEQEEDKRLLDRDGNPIGSPPPLLPLLCDTEGAPSGVVLTGDIEGTTYITPTTPEGTPTGSSLLSFANFEKFFDGFSNPFGGRFKQWFGFLWTSPFPDNLVCVNPIIDLSIEAMGRYKLNPISIPVCVLSSFASWISAIFTLVYSLFAIRIVLSA